MLNVWCTGHYFVSFFFNISSLHFYLLTYIQLFQSHATLFPYTTLFRSLCNPMDCSLPGSSVHGDSPGKNTGKVAMPSSMGSSQPRDQIQLSHIVGGFFTVWTTRETYAKRGRKEFLKSVRNQVFGNGLVGWLQLTETRRMEILKWKGRVDLYKILLNVRKRKPLYW